MFKFGLLVNYLFPEIGNVGLQFRSHPKEIMTEVLKTFRDLDIGWKKTGAYNVKCRWLAPTSSSGDAAPTPGGITDPPIAGSMYRPSSSDCWTADMHGDPNAQTKDSNVAGILSNLVKFELQVHFIYFTVHWLSLIYKEAAHLLYGSERKIFLTFTTKSSGLVPHNPPS